MALSETLKLTMEEGKDGVCRFTQAISDIHHNVVGTLHGGVIATLIDNAIARAIRSTLPAEAQIMTIGLNISYFEAVKDGSVQVTGRATFAGRRLIHGEAEIRSDDRLIARGTGTWYVRPPGRSVE